MRALAAFIMKGRAQAVLAIAVLTIFSWVFSLASLLSMAAVALPTLRKGWLEGAITIAAALLPVSAAGWMAWGNPLPAAGYALALWGPMWLTAILLRESGQLSLALTGLSGLGLLMVVGIHGFFGDPAAMWLEQSRRLFGPVLEQGTSTAEAELLWRSFAEFARYLTGVIAAGSVLALTLGLLIARWWQAMLFNPGGFRAEFVNLRIPAAAAYLGLGLLAFIWLSGGGWPEVAINLTIPLAMLFLMGGFAVLHALLSESGGGRFWLIGIYMALMFVSPLVVMVVLIGFSDAWIDWRHRLSRA